MDNHKEYAIVQANNRIKLKIKIMETIPSRTSEHML